MEILFSVILSSSTIKTFLRFITQPTLRFRHHYQSPRRFGRDVPAASKIKEQSQRHSHSTAENSAYGRLRIWLGENSLANWSQLDPTLDPPATFAIWVFSI